MKISSLFVLLLGMMIYPFTQVTAQEVKADDIVGVWLNQDKDAHITIYKEGEKFYGKISWLKEPIDSITGKPKVDDKNKDVSLQNRPVMGLLLLKDFVFDGDDEWEDGEIYDPKSGNDYSCYMEFPDNDNKDKLKIRGYIGISLFGRTDYWTRVKE